MCHLYECKHDKDAADLTPEDDDDDDYDDKGDDDYDGESHNGDGKYDADCAAGLPELTNQLRRDRRVRLQAFADVTDFLLSQSWILSRQLHMQPFGQVHDPDQRFGLLPVLLQVFQDLLVVALEPVPEVAIEVLDVPGEVRRFLVGVGHGGRQARFQQICRDFLWVGLGDRPCFHKT